MQDEKKLQTLISEISENDFTQVERFLVDYNNCPLCGDELLFTHTTHFIDLAVEEKAHCESCHIKVKENTYSLQ